MAIRPFLAMTAAEMRKNSGFSGKIAWMACHFSPYGLGLSNLPASLPPDSLLILNDRTPIRGHDPQLICRQLSECIAALGCGRLLLDFQRPDCSETKDLTKHLASALPCPVGVTEWYAEDMDCSVFLSPVPPSAPLEEHIVPWVGRDIWLEIALDGEVITLTEEGAQAAPLIHPDPTVQGFADEALHCHYQIQLEDDAAKFTLWRTREDLEALIAEAERLSITAAVGLYQELRSL